VDGACRYRGAIPFYGTGGGLPPHGYIIPRDHLDAAMLAAAAKAGATVHEQTLVTAVDAGPSGIALEARRGTRTARYRAKLVAGADGVNSVVARHHSQSVDDPRHIAVAQRAYATVNGYVGEAAFFFDEDVFPGYGWMFPIAGGRVNLGVGILSETRRARDAHVPRLFANFVERLRAEYPGCQSLELCAPAIGGVVKTYGAAGRNHFDGGLLVGDAGSFVDPMTGEGITPAMESAMLAARTLAAALDAGRFDQAQLSAYESDFRAYFDPAMLFLDLCAATLRNRHLARPWLNALGRGCDVAQTDEAFARTGGSYFGQMWVRVMQDVALAWPRLLTGAAGDGSQRITTVADLLGWQTAWMRSLVSDPGWHARWTVDVQRKWLRLLATAGPTEGDPRFSGVAEP
jgi:flavin-dependent dehydrogenase